MDGQSNFIDAFLPAGFGRNERLERISALLDWSRIATIVAPVRPGAHGRPASLRGTENVPGAPAAAVVRALGSGP